MPQSVAEQLVARGAKKLDKKLPGWHKQIVLQRLDMQDPCSCVFGQLGSKKVNLDRLGYELDPDPEGDFPDLRYDGYDRMIEALNIDIRHDEDNLLGLEAVESNPWRPVHWRGKPVTTTYAALQSAWEAEIKARRKADREAAKLVG